MGEAYAEVTLSWTRALRTTIAEYTYLESKRQATVEPSTQKSLAASSYVWIGPLDLSSHSKVQERSTSASSAYMTSFPAVKRN